MTRLFTLGDLRLESDDGTIVSRRRKTLALLACLARRSPRSVSRTELGALLWGDRPETRARQSLRQALLELHRFIGPSLAITSDAVTLAAHALSSDVADFERAVDDGQDDVAIHHWGGDFLAGEDFRANDAMRSWLEIERAALRRRLTLSYQRLLDDAQRRGDHDQALAIARCWAHASSHDELACERLIHALRASGRTAEALAEHGAFVARLREELALLPSRAFVKLGRAVLSEAIDSPRSHSDGTPHPHAFPLTGREEAFAALTVGWGSRSATHDVVALIESVPGMGSARLLQAFTDWCAARDTSTLILASDGEWESEDRYSGARRVLAKLTSSPSLGGLDEARLVVLATLLPALRTRFGKLVEPQDVPTVESLAEVVAEALAVAADDGPVLIVLGRLLAMDEASRALFECVLGATTGGTMTIAVVSEADERKRVLGAVPPSCVVAVPPLAGWNAAHVGALLDAVIRVHPDDRTLLVARLLRETGGVPGLLVPTLRELVAVHALVPTTGDSGPLMSPLGEQELPLSPSLIHTLQLGYARLGVLPAAMLAASVRLNRACTPVELASDAAISSSMADDSVAELQRGGWLVSRERGAWALSAPILRRVLTNIATPQSDGRVESEASEIASRAGRRTSSRHRRRRTLLGVGLGALALAASVFVATRATSVSASRGRAVHSVAVFPFAVSGDGKLNFLRIGMVDLLSTSLDGVAELQTIDPRVVLAAASTAGSSTSASPALVIAAARRLGASQVVLGTVVGAGGRIIVNARLYLVSDSMRPVVHASASGSEADLFAVVDQIAGQLAVGRGAASHDRLTQLAAVTTTSLDALKAYLAGRSAYRANDLFLALTSYEHAVAIDSTFALAWYALASTASWMLRPDIEQAAIAAAVRHGGRLSDRDRALIDGFAAYSSGAADSAEKLATSVAQSYDDIEGWVLLGEVLYHHNWKRGRSLVESRRAWERVLALDSTYWPALQHLAEVAAVENRPRVADSLLARYERSVGTAHMMLASRAMRAYAYGTAEQRAQVEPLLVNDRGFWLTLSVWYVSVFGHDLARGQDLARALVVSTRPREQQGFGHVLLAHLALARGSWREARRELALARMMTPVDALEYELLLQLAPFVTTSPAELNQTLRALAAHPDDADDRTMTLSWPHTQGRLHATTRRYLQGMVAARTGREEHRVESLARLAALPDPTSHMALATGYAASIRAEHERAQHHPAAALLLLDHGARASPFLPAWTSSFVSQAYERYLRGELLHELGRDDEALRWYHGFDENSPYDLIYLAPSLYREAQIHDQRGERRLAAVSYERFLTLWRNADQEFAPMLANARLRLALQH